MRHMFMDLLVLADPTGRVDMTFAAIARRINVPIKVVRVNICKLCKSDPSSRTTKEDGKRLIPLSDDRDWGWQIVNFTDYHAMRDEDARRDYMRTYMRERRAKDAPCKHPVNTCKHPLTQLAHVDVDVDVDTHKEAQDPPAGSNLHDWTITFGRWWGALKHANANPGYLGVLDPFFTTERRFEFAKFKVETDDLGRYHGLLKPWQLRDMLWDDLKGYREHQAEGAKVYRAWQGKAGKLVEDVAAAIGERTAEGVADRTARKPKGE